MEVQIADDIRNLTIKDTKAVLLDAVDELAELLDTEVKVPEKTEGQEHSIEMMPMEPLGPEKRNSDFVPSTKHFSLGNSLNIFSSDILDKIKAVEDIVNERRTEIKKLEMLENKLFDCVEKINSDRLTYFDTISRNKEKVNEKTNDYSLQIENLKTGYEEKIEDAKKTLDQLKADIDQKKKVRDLGREKENEQYEYEMSIQAGREDDAWNDRLLKRESVLKVLATEIKDLKEELSDKEKNVKNLKEKLDELPALIAKAKEEGALSKRKEMEEDNKHRMELAKRESAAELATLNDMLSNLETDYEEKVKERDSLRAKLDRAYDESNKLYLQTVQSTGGIKILGSEKK